jgi:hypothetical protein
MGRKSGMMENWERKLRISEIRKTATLMVLDLGECNDYRIMFCASAVRRIRKMALTLEGLDDTDLLELYLWIVEGVIPSHTSK